MSKEAILIHKQSWKKSIFKHGKWYFLTSLLTKGIGFILIPIHTAYLTPDDYGVLNTLKSIGGILPIFVSLYIDSAVIRFYHDKKQSNEELKILFSTIYWFVLIWGAFIVSLSVFSAPIWMKKLLGIESYPFAYLAFIPVLFTQIGFLGSVFLRQSLQSIKISIIEIVSVALSLGVSMPLLIIAKYGVIAKLLGFAVVSLFVFFFYTFYFFRNKLLSLRFNGSLLIKCLAFSIPLIPNIAGGWIAGFSDRIILAGYSGLKNVGLYSLAYQLAISLYILQDAITQVQGPISISGLIYDKEATKEKIAKFSLILFGLMLTAHLFLMLFAQEIVVIFASKEYAEAYKVVGIIGFTYVLSSQYRIFTTIISYHKKMWIISSGAILMGLSNLLLNLLLIPKYHQYAASATTVISVFFYSLWIVLWSLKLEPIILYIKESIFLFTVYLIVTILYVVFFSDKITIYSIVIKIVLLTISGACFIYIVSKLRKHKQDS